MSLPKASTTTAVGHIQSAANRNLLDIVCNADESDIATSALSILKARIKVISRNSRNRPSDDDYF